jgi:hypothetical protein
VYKESNANENGGKDAKKIKKICQFLTCENARKLFLLKKEEFCLFVCCCLLLFLLLLFCLFVFCFAVCVCVCLGR